MKVSVAYRSIKDVEIEVDDKFKALNQIELQYDRKTLQYNLIADIYDQLPNDAEVISIFDTESDKPLYEN